jgi:hypothetical protein
MKRDFRTSVGLIALAVSCIIVQALPSQARKWTVTQRQNKLEAEINAGQKSGDLTFKQANNFRNDLANVLDREAKMEANNNGRLSDVDQNKIEKELNGISVNIQKKKLAKRVK